MAVKPLGKGDQAAERQKAANRKNYDQRRVLRREDAQAVVAEHALAVVKDELRAARHEQDVASNQEELATAAAKVEALERKRRKQRQKIDEAEEQAVEDRGKILAALKKKMVQNVANETLFIIRRRVK